MHPLSASGDHIRQERQKNLALLRGDVIGPGEPLVEGAEVSALYVTAPCYFPVEFGGYSDQEGEIVIAWLAPITTEEADYIIGHGWNAFEDVLADQDPELVDFGRSGVPLPC